MRFAAGLLLALTACSSASRPPDIPPPPPGESNWATIEQLDALLFDEPGDSLTWEQGAEIRKTTPVILGEAATALLDRFQGMSERGTTFELVSEGQFLLPDKSKMRRYRVRRYLGFEDLQRAREVFPQLEEPELQGMYDPVDGRYEVLQVEMSFSLPPSRNRRAFRVILDGLWVRRLHAEVVGLYVDDDAKGRYVIAFTSRQLMEEPDEKSGKREFATTTVAFNFWVEVGQEDFHSGRMASDWVALSAQEGPYSVQVSVYDSEDISVFVKKTKDFGWTILNAIGSVRRIGVF